MSQISKFVLKDAVITVDGNNLSDHASNVSLELTTDEVDVTSMTASSFRETLDGFKDASINVTFFSDFAAGKTDAILWPLSQAGTAFPVTVKATSAATSSTNPIFSLPAARLYNYSPIAGGVGDAASSDVVFKNGGTAGLTRGTT